jgi:hypothetical protein
MIMGMVIERLAVCDSSIIQASRVGCNKTVDGFKSSFELLRLNASYLYPTKKNIISQYTMSNHHDDPVMPVVDKHVYIPHQRNVSFHVELPKRLQRRHARRLQDRRARLAEIHMSTKRQDSDVLRLASESA